MNAYLISAIVGLIAGTAIIDGDLLNGVVDDVTSTANLAVARNDEMGSLIHDLREELPNTAAEWDAKYPEKRAEAVRRIAALQSLKTQEN